MTKILRYNWRFYAATVTGLCIAWFAAWWVSPVWRVSILGASVPAVFWTCSSLLVSYYVYDRPALYSLGWLDRCLSRAPARWVFIHAGLDETSDRLAARYPSSQSQILDIFDPREMTEQSIQEARNTQSRTSKAADWRALPLRDAEMDTAFLLFAAHELRRPEARAQFFREVARVVSVDGAVILVEHLRDWANFLAFGPGFLHFLDERAWRQAAVAGGLQIRDRFQVTPFVNVFVMRRVS
jgi:signal transduction histidine kinase